MYNRRLPMHALVIRPGALGDVLLTLPALQALQSAWPDARIELMGNLEVLRWLPRRSVVSAVSSFDRADLGALFQPDGHAAESLRGYLQQFDWIVSFATPPEHVFARNLATVARGEVSPSVRRGRYSISPSVRRGSVVSFNARPGDLQQMHMSDYLQAPLRDLGIGFCHDVPRISLTRGDLEAAGKWWAEREPDSRPVVAIHPGSGSATKNWPAGSFAAVARHVQEEWGARVLLISGPADRQAVLDVQAALGNDPCTVVDGLSLECLAAVLTRCHLYVGNDSGVSHLAAAVGTPTVAIFGPTDPVIWSPRGATVRVVQGHLPCAPCSDGERWACRDQGCLSGLPVEAVLAEVRELILLAGVRQIAPDTL